jgi:DNA repair photolyase
VYCPLVQSCLRAHTPAVPATEYRLEPCRSALNPVTGMPFRWSLNPYMGCAHRCTFCYVRAFEQRADRPADDRYGRSIRVKTNVVGVLRAELSRPSWAHEPVAVGAATDPYQPAEGRFRLSRGCLEAFHDHWNPFSIITRGPLVIRDLDVLQAASHRARVSVSLSIPTLDDEIWRVTEPGTAPPRARLRAVRRLADAGIRVGVSLAPILPGLSDRPELLADAVRAARDAGASKLWTEIVHLKPGTREHFLTTLAAVWPAEAARIDALYARRAYPSPAESQDNAARVAALDRAHPRRASAPRPIDPEPPRLAVQLGLAFDDDGALAGDSAA